MNKETSITVMVPGSRLFVEKVCDTFEEGIDLCVDSLKVQLAKFKENCAIDKKIAKSFGD